MTCVWSQLCPRSSPQQLENEGVTLPDMVHLDKWTCSFVLWSDLELNKDLIWNYIWKGLIFFHFLKGFYIVESFICNQFQLQGLVAKVKNNNTIFTCDYMLYEKCKQTNFTTLLCFKTAPTCINSSKDQICAHVCETKPHVHFQANCAQWPFKWCRTQRQTQQPPSVYLQHTTHPLRQCVLAAGITAGSS